MKFKLFIISLRSKNIEVFHRVTEFEVFFIWIFS